MIINFSFHWIVILDCKLTFCKAYFPKLLYLFYCYFTFLVVCYGRIFSLSSSFTLLKLEVKPNITYLSDVDVR